MTIRYLLLAAVLAGCTGSENPPKASRATRAERMQAAEELVSKTPVPRTYRLDSGELKVVDVPSKDNLGLVDVQRCYIWRDTEFRTSSISCGQPPDLVVPTPNN